MVIRASSKGFSLLSIQSPFTIYLIPHTHIRYIFLLFIVKLFDIIFLRFWIVNQTFHMLENPSSRAKLYIIS